MIIILLTGHNYAILKVLLKEFRKKRGVKDKAAKVIK